MRIAYTKKPYSDNEANKIFTITKELQDKGTKSDRISKDDIYLITLIAAYSGMRLNEIVQLTTNDIKEIDGVLCFDINTNIGANGVKRQ